MPRSLRVVVPSAIACLAPAALAQQANITAFPGLPSPINTPNSGPVGITNAGHVVGLTNLYGFDPATNISYPGITHTFFSTAPAAATDFGVIGIDPPPFVFPRGETTGQHVNNLDQVACICTDAASTGVVRAAAWLPQPAYGLPAGLTALPPLVSLNIDRAFDMNESGQLVGESRTATNDVRPVRWDVQGGTATVTDVAPGFGPNGRAMAINNLGQVVGQVNEPNPIPFDNYFQAFIYLPNAAYGLPAGVNILQAPGVETALNFGFPNDINDLGQIVGRTAGFNWTPAVWLPSPALGLPAGVTVFDRPVFPDSVYAELNSVGLSSAEFTSINENGVAVGEAVFNVWIQFPRPRIVGQSHAFMWRNGQFSILEDFKPLNSPWRQIYRATSINDSNQILASAVDNQGNFRAITISLDAPPCPNGFFRQPAPVTVCQGDTAALNVWAISGGGGDLTYQWQHDGVPLVDGTTESGSIISGSGTNGLFIANAGAADIGDYSVVISNSCGTLASSAATLTVTEATAITAQPSGVVACPDGPATFHVGATGSNVGFTWEVEDPGLPGNWLSIFDDPMTAGDVTFSAGGAFTDTLVVSTVQGSPLPRSLNFHALVFGDCGETVSEPAALTICPADFNCSGAISVQDIFDYLAAYFSNDRRADFNASGAVSVQDIFDYLAAYFGGC